MSRINEECFFENILYQLLHINYVFLFFNRQPTTLALKQTGIGILDLSLTPDSYIKEE